MVVTFDGGADKRCDEQTIATKNRRRDKRSSIFDYVHLSSKLLSKVRYGQSLEAAVQQSSVPKYQSTRPSTPSRAAWTPGEPITSQLIQRDISKPTPSRVNHHQFAYPKSTNQRLDKLETASKFIRYRRLIQLQAVDGGFLCVDNDGRLCKLNHTSSSDPRTLLTPFNHDPLQITRAKSSIRCEDLIFLVQGATTITKQHVVVHADAAQLSEPPPTLAKAVERHVQCNKSSIQLEGPETVTTASNIWSFRRVRGITDSSLSSTSESKQRKEFIQTGMLVQLVQNNLTVHYEKERVKKRKYRPLNPGGEAGGQPERSGNLPRTESAASFSATSESIPSSSSESTPSSNTHVWLQENSVSSQTNTRLEPMLKRWDNVWIIRAVGDLNHINAQGSSSQLSSVFLSVTGDQENTASSKVSSNASSPVQSSLSKQISNLNAQIIVRPADDPQWRAAAIIVRFLRRVCQRETRKRAKDLIRLRLRSPERAKGAACKEYELNIEEQLRVLQCFKPSVFGSQRRKEPTARRIPGISFQGSKYLVREQHHLQHIEKDLRLLDNESFSPQPWLLQPTVDDRQLFSRPKSSPSKSSHQIATDRTRENKFHVELKMVRREKPPFRFGKAARPQTAPLVAGSSRL